MAHFIITFRIKSDDDYQKRYNSFTEQVIKRAGGAGSVWDETSSFYSLKANLSAADLCNVLYLYSDFDSTKDLMVVIDVDNGEKATLGPLRWPGVLDATIGF